MAKHPPNAPPNLSPWATHLGVRYADLVEATLASAMRRSAQESVASSSATQYSYVWEKIFWCNSIQHPRCPIHVDGLTLAL
jgi:hypothetical protein